jgi:hypothetical protein
LAQQGKQMRIGASKGMHSVKVGLLADGNRHEVDSNAFFLKKKKIIMKPSIYSK